MESQTVTREDCETIEEVASRFRRSTRTIKRWVKDDGMPHVKLNAELLFPKASVDAWFREKTGLEKLAGNGHAAPAPNGSAA